MVGGVEANAGWRESSKVVSRRGVACRGVARVPRRKRSAATVLDELADRSPAARLRAVLDDFTIDHAEHQHDPVHRWDAALALAKVRREIASMRVVSRVQVLLGVAPAEAIALVGVAACFEGGLEAQFFGLEPAQPLQHVAQFVAEALDEGGVGWVGLRVKVVSESAGVG